MMSPGDDTTGSSERRSRHRSREDRRHTKCRSRSPTRKKHRRSESKRRKKRSKSRRRSYSSSSSSSSLQKEKKKRRKSKHSKHSKKRKHRHRDERCSDESDSDVCNDATQKTSTINIKSAIDDKSMEESDDKKPAAAEPEQPETTVQTEPKGPMTQAQYLQLQSQIREVVDPVTGRIRLVRGTGEIIERIVSRNEHQNLNAQATRGDGDGFAREVARQAMRKRMGG